VTKLHNAPAFKARMPSTAEAMKMSEGSLPALLALILLLFVPYAAGTVCHFFGVFTSISVAGLGDFDAALAFLLVTMLAIRGAVLHGILSSLALRAELEQAMMVIPAGKTLAEFTQDQRDLFYRELAEATAPKS
jgi:hypothetical protein